MIARAPPPALPRPLPWPDVNRYTTCEIASRSRTLTLLVSSKITGSDRANPQACSIQYGVDSHDSRSPWPLSSGIPHTEAATRAAVDFPLEESPANSTTKIWQSGMSCSRTEASEV